MANEYSERFEVPSAPAASQLPLRIDIVTLFPDMFSGPFAHSMIARAIEAGLVDLRIHGLRHWAMDRHQTTDDYAYGGGGGMVMKPEPVFAAVEDVLGIPPITSANPGPPPSPVLLMTPQGRRFDDSFARELAGHDRLVLLCGHYEGFDERIRLHLATHEVSVGDFVVTGGELPAMIVADAVARLRPGVLGLESGTARESFADGLLEHPHYTRPADFRGWTVPDVLVSGNHGAIERWRHDEAVARTRARRPDLPGVAPDLPGLAL
jgi:tRNA (guanine37-N1)-methyltransferase